MSAYEDSKSIIKTQHKNRTHYRKRQVLPIRNLLLSSDSYFVENLYKEEYLAIVSLFFPAALIFISCHFLLLFTHGRFLFV